MRATKRENTGQLNSIAGYSLVELIVSLVLTLVILGIAVTTFSSALSSRTREAGTTDGITSAQAALNIMSREIGNAGYGLLSNGIVVADSGPKRLRIRTNTNNTISGSNGFATSAAGEDVTFFYDSASQSVVRFDSNLGTTSGVINQVSDVDFEYTNYALDGTPSAGSVAANTGRVTIILTVILPNVQGQPTGRTVRVKSDVALRNSTYQLGQY